MTRIGNYYYGRSADGLAAVELAEDPGDPTRSFVAVLEDGKWWAPAGSILRSDDWPPKGEVFIPINPVARQ